MAFSNTLRKLTGRFRKSEAGATAVEFVIVLPVMLVCFATIVEGSRIFWNYQAAVSGVRDAARYIARITDPGLCTGTSTATGPLTAEVATARTIIERNLDVGVDGGGASLFPTAVSLPDPNPVAVNYVCTPVTGLDSVPIVRVDATVRVVLPFNRLVRFFQIPNGQMQSTITDQARIFGI